MPMTPLRYITITNVCLIMFASSFMVGFMVGKEDKMVFHSHFVSLIDEGDVKKKKKIDHPKEIPVVATTLSAAVVPPDLVIDPMDDEFECLARTIYFEAGNQSYNGKVAVGSVVMNRVNDVRYPNTICEVVKQYKQFSWYSDGKPDKPWKNSPAWKDSNLAAKEVLCGCGNKAVVFDDSSVQYYHADYVNPRWAKQLKRVAKIDEHIFYK